jgi:hypothetical protein
MGLIMIGFIMVRNYRCFVWLIIVGVIRIKYYKGNML